MEQQKKKKRREEERYLRGWGCGVLFGGIGVGGVLTEVVSCIVSGLVVVTGGGVLYCFVLFLFFSSLQ